jgi:hypothetical protein
VIGNDRLANALRYPVVDIVDTVDWALKAA